MGRLALRRRRPRPPLGRAGLQIALHARPTARPPDQLEPGGDVAPLVGAAHLELDAERPVQVGEVVCLEQHVAELGERQPALQADLDRVLGEHVRDREVLAGVAQELDQRELAEPVEVVDQDRAGPRREVEEALELAPDRGRRSPPASRRRAGSARSSGPTGRRSSPSRHRRARPAGRRTAAAGSARRSGPGGRRGATRPTDRTRCSPRSGDRSPAGPAARASSRAGCPRHSSSPRSRFGAGRPDRRHSGRTRAVSTHRGAHCADRPSVHAPYAIVRPQMQTSLARRQRHRRALEGRPKGRPAPSSRRIVVIVLLFIILSTVLLAGAGVVFAVGAYNYYASGLPDPATALTNLEFEQQTIVYDRTGKIELARLGELKREVVTFDQIPGEIDRRHDLDRGQGLLEQRRVRSGRHRLGRSRHRLRPAARRVDHHPAARPRPPPPDRSVRRAPPTNGRSARSSSRSASPRRTRARPASRQIMTAYLNQNFYGNRSYGVKAAAKGYFGKSLADLTLAQDAILAAIPQSPTKFDLDAQRQRGLQRERGRGRGLHEVRAHRSAGLGDRPAAEPRPRPDEVAQSADRLRSTPRPSTTRRSSSPSSCSRRPRSTGRHPSSCGRSAALAEILCPDTPSDCPAVDTGGYKVITTIDLGHAEDRREVGLRRRSGAECPDPRAVLASKKIGAADRKWILGARAATTSTTPLERSSTTGRATCWPTSGSASYTSKGNVKFQPQFDVLADGWRQPGSAIKPIDYAIGIDDGTLTASTMLMDVTTNFGGRATCRSRPTSSNAARSASARRSSSRSTSRPSRRRS